MKSWLLLLLLLLYSSVPSGPFTRRPEHPLSAEVATGLNLPSLPTAFPPTPIFAFLSSLCILESDYPVLVVLTRFATSNISIPLFVDN
jgi:hypothetical protein